MPAYVTLTLHIKNKTIADLRTLIDKPHPRQLREIMNLIKGGMLGLERQYARAQLASAVASGTITGTPAGTAVNDTVTIAGTTLTLVASPANENQFADSAVQATLATNLKNCINAHSTLSKIVWAEVTTSASGIVTVYSKIPGPIGNLITLAEVGGYSVSGANLAGGASDEMDEFYLGYSPGGAVAG